MVRLTKALLGAVLALSVVLTPALSQVTTSTKPTASGPPGNATATPTPTTNFHLPTPTPTTAPPVTPNPGQQVRCPAIMIPDPDPGVVIHGRACVGGCCVRCPAINSFYEPHKIDNVLKAAYFIRQASLGFAIFMAISYLVLPGKRSQPHISVLFLTVSLSLWYAAFDVMPGYSNACANDVDPSTGSNNKLCGVQGVLIIYLTQTSALWCSLLIYKLHLVSYHCHSPFAFYSIWTFIFHFFAFFFVPSEYYF